MLNLSFVFPECPELKCSVQLELRNLSLPEIAQVNSKMIWLKVTDEDEGKKVRLEYFISLSILW